MSRVINTFKLKRTLRIIAEAAYRKLGKVTETGWVCNKCNRHNSFLVKGCLNCSLNKMFESNPPEQLDMFKEMEKK